MNDITKRFLEYKKKPKQTLEVLCDWPKLYPHEGYLSNQETKEERQERLATALAQGYYLRPNDFKWMLQFNSKRKILSDYRDVVWGLDRELSEYRHSTVRILRG